MQSAARKEKLAAALRANLKRRKERARALKGQVASPGTETQPPSEIRPNKARKPG